MNRWKTRLRAFASPLLQTPRYRVLLLLVLIGILLISTLPEAAFVLPALDAVGLDLLTILVAVELRHYLAAVAGLVPIPRRLVVYRHAPALCFYDCMWPVIWIRTLKGTMSVPRPARG